MKPGHQWHEDCAPRRAELERLRRLVAGRAHRCGRMGYWPHDAATRKTPPTLTAHWRRRFYSSIMDNRKVWTEIMRATIGFNALFFNSQWMLEEYLTQAYRERRPAKDLPSGKRD
jgi:hypothetical protein